MSARFRARSPFHTAKNGLCLVQHAHRGRNQGKVEVDGQVPDELALLGEREILERRIKPSGVEAVCGRFRLIVATRLRPLFAPVILASGWVILW